MILKSNLFFILALCILNSVFLIKTVKATDLSTRVLLVGDSQSVGPFGLKLDSLLRKKFTVETYASCGSTLEWWRSGQPTRCGLLQIDQNGRSTTATNAPTPKLEAVLDRFRPDFVIFEFGGNYRHSSADFIAKDIQTALTLVERMGARCFFVSNPDSRFKPTTRLDLPKALEDAVQKRCDFFRSDLVTKYPSIGGDGYHYSFKAGVPIAHSWAEKVYAEFLKLL